jgi:nucleotide-binding universal stress UspA family protein
MSTENTDTRDRIDEPSYRHILVPTDDSEESRLAMEHAVTLAQLSDGRIHALSIDEGAGSSNRDHLRSDPEEEAEEATSESAKQAKSEGVPVTGVVRSGSAKEQICAYADESDIDIIVIGTEGRTGISGAIFASVAEQIVREAPVPVLTVRPGNHD